VREFKWGKAFEVSWESSSKASFLESSWKSFGKFFKLKWVWTCEVSRVSTISIVCAWKKLNVCLKEIECVLERFPMKRGNYVMGLRLMEHVRKQAKFAWKKWIRNICTWTREGSRSVEPLLTSNKHFFKVNCNLEEMAPSLCLIVSLGVCLLHFEKKCEVDVKWQS